MRNTHFIQENRNAQAALRNTHLETKIARMKIGEQIRKIRKAKGLKLAEVENRAGLSEGNLSRIERSVQWVSEDGLFAIAEALEISPAQFFGEIEAVPGHIDPDVLLEIITVLRSIAVEDQKLALAQIRNLADAAGARSRRAAMNKS